MSCPGLRPVSTIAVVCLTLTAVTAAHGEDTDRVVVTNFPEIQTIQGQVSVDSPVPQAKLLRVSEEIVSPVAPDDTASLAGGGTLLSAGFVSVVLSLTGQIKADYFAPGSVGAFLVPEEELVRRAFNEGGQLLFPLRVEAEVRPDGTLYFSSDQPLYRLAFPRYRVYFYNTTDRPAAVTLYAYLTN